MDHCLSGNVDDVSRVAVTPQQECEPVADCQSLGTARRRAGHIVMLLTSGSVATIGAAATFPMIDVYSSVNGRRVSPVRGPR
jgi:hypothetical protein